MYVAAIEGDYIQMAVWMNWVKNRNTKNYGASAVKCH
jgi:hypothetical protein